jgi:galactose-1-phosphate uridylyltransferase
MKHKIKIHMEIDIEVSAEYLEKLEKNLYLEIVKNCFKNHNRTIVNESMEIIESKEMA